MASNWLLFLLLGAVWTVQGRVLEPTDQDQSVDLYETAADNYDMQYLPFNDMAYDDYEEEMDVDLAEVKQFLDLIAEEKAIEDFLCQQSDLEACSGGKCQFCLFPKVLKRFRTSLCAKAELRPNGIYFSVNLGSRTVFRKFLSVGGNHKFTISKNRFPRLLRRAITKDLEIEVNGIDIRRKRFCIKVQVRLRFIGRVSYPRRGFKCFSF